MPEELTHLKSFLPVMAIASQLLSFSSVAGGQFKAEATSCATCSIDHSLTGAAPLENTHCGGSVSAAVQAGSKSASGREREKMGSPAARRLPTRSHRRIHCTNVSATSDVTLRPLDSAARQAWSLCAIAFQAYYSLQMAAFYCWFVAVYNSCSCMARRRKGARQSIGTHSSSCVSR